MNEVNQLIFDGKALCDAVWEDTSLWSRNYTEAINKFQRALSLDPENTTALINLGAAYSDTGKHHLALETLMKAERLGSDDKNLYFNIAVVMTNLGKHRSKVKVYFTKAYKLKPRPNTLETYFDPHGY